MKKVDIDILKEQLEKSRLENRALKSELVLYKNYSGFRNNISSIFQVIPDSAFLYKLSNGTIINTNEEFVSLTGFEMDEVIGKKVNELDLFKPNYDVEKWNKEVIRNHSLLLINKFGKEIKAVLSTSFMNFDNEDYVVCIFTALNNVLDSDRRAQEYLSMLSELEETLGTFLDNSPIGIAIANENGVIETWSKKLSELTSIEENQVIQKDHIYALNLLNEFNLGDSQSVIRDIKKFTRDLENDIPNTKSIKFKLSLHFPDRGRIDLQNLLFSFKTKKGLKLAYLIFEITEQRKFEESILQYKMIFENNLDGIAILDLNNSYILSNKAHEKIIAYTSKEILSKNPSVFLGENLFGEIYKVFDYQKLFEGELKGVSKTGEELLLDYTLFPVNSGNTHLYTIEIIRDISSRKKSEKQVYEALRKAEMADKLKTAFLSNMSHEIRTPMNAIIGFSSLLENSDISAEKRLKYIKYISKNGKGLLSIIDDILDLAKIESNELSINKAAGDLSQLMNNLYSTLMKMIEKEGKTEVELRKNFEEHEDLVLYTDFRRLEQILLNLSYNAIKFTNKGFIEFGFKINDAKNEILFHIADTGIGIAENKLANIFERFSKIEYSKTKVYNGAGLGLAISKQLVSLLGGNIWLESELNKGTTFYFSLPYTQLSQAATIKKVPDNSELMHNWSNKKILIVEDDLFSFELLHEFLSETDAEIIHASDGKKSVSMFAENKDVDIILMDIQLPGINGLQASKLILEINSTIPIIAQSAYAMNEDRKVALEAGCKDFISKPVDKELLFDILSQYLD